MSLQSGLNCGLPALHTLLGFSAHSLFLLPVVTETEMGTFELTTVFMASDRAAEEYPLSSFP